jgi:hypothetical protein
MIRFLSCAIFFLAIAGAFIAQQPPPSAPWNVTMQTNTVADSNLTVVNRCKKNHQFQIQTQNVPFLQLSANQANVKGGQNQVLPVKFDTRNLAPGVHQGTVLVLCRTCGSEPTCTQDREVLQVNLTVTGEPTGTPTSPSQIVTQTTDTKSGGPPLVMARVDSSMVANQIVHVESNYGGMANDWVIEIKTQAGTKGFIHVRTEKRPDLKYCDWIKVGAAEDKGGSTWVDSIEKTKDPTKKVEGPEPGDTKPVTPPVEPPKPGPEGPATGGPGGKTEPQPCKDGDVRNKSDAEVKEFQFLDENSQVTIQFYTDIDGPLNAGKNMADFWKKGAKVLKALDKLTGGTAGSSPAGWLLKYLEQGGNLLDAVATSGLANRAREVTVQIDATTTKVKVTKWTAEVCEKGVWVKKVFCEKAESKGTIKRADTIRFVDQERWGTIANDNKPQLFDSKKVEAWATAYISSVVGEFKDDAYKEFTKDCP